jgi:phosphoglycerol transferase MdoB-like AlkP superfamily enzyme
MQYTKDILKVATMILVAVVAVLGWHWTDEANRSFWWNFWVVAAIICLIACIGGWVYLSNKKK